MSLLSKELINLKNMSSLQIIFIVLIVIYILSGVNILEFNNPNIKKMTDKKSDHSLIFSPLINGYKLTIKKKTQKTIPKLLFEPTVILLIELIIQ